VRSRRDGVRVVYRLASDRVGELWAAVRDVAASHVAEVTVLAGEYLGDRRDVESVSAEELATRLSRGEAVALDVRPEVEYLAGHIAGAQSAPVDELAARVGELQGQGEVIAYCRGPYCVYADDAVRIMRNRGLTARRLDVGFPEWRHAGLPVAAGGGG
jgi:rhodanese-related sulfurtransferase